MLPRLAAPLLAIATLATVLPLSTQQAEAQMSVFTCPGGRMLSVAEGKELLQKVQVRYAGLDSMSGTFRQESYVAALDEGEASSGEMVFAKPGRMRWTYRVPREQEVVIRERELWLYQVDKRQVMIDDIGNVLLSNLPVSFMMGIGDLARDFELRGACRTPEGVVLNLVPQKARASTDKTQELEGFQLLVDEGQKLPKGAKITSLGGNVTAIIFENLKVGSTQVEERRFVLDLPKGVDVMDRRLQ